MTREALAQPEPSQWRDMVVVSLVREGVNKHRARKLADHFAAQPVQEPVPEKEWIYGTPLLDAMTQDYVPSQRPWVGLTEEEAIELLPVGDWEIESTLEFAKAIETKLKEKNI